MFFEASLKKARFFLQEIMTIQEFKNFATKEILNSPSPQLDVQILTEHITGYSKTELLLNRDKNLSEKQLDWLKNAVDLRKTGLPVAYITGKKEFFGYEFNVSPAVLIPKPDTEILVEKAIDLAIEKIEAHPEKILTICDMCTGSGCIGISVLKSLSEQYNIPSERLPKITLVDISLTALEVAESNARKLLSANEKSHVRFVRSNLFEQIPYTFDLILTNPPYIPHSMVDELLKDGRSEPRLALDGDITLTGDRAIDKFGDLADDGLEIIRNLFMEATERLSPGGEILMETGEYNMPGAEKIARLNGFSKTEIYNDFSDQMRVLRARF